MKTKILLLLAIGALFLSACSSSLFVSTGYDDLYYEPGDELMMSRPDPVAYQDAYEAIDYAPANNRAVEETVFYQEDTLQGEEEFYETGDEEIIVNNYYENESGEYLEEGYYTKRINRFHRPYSVRYYSSFYDPYWYDPFWYDYYYPYIGTSFYWGWGGFGFGYPYYSYRYPYYSYGYPYYSYWDYYYRDRYYWNRYYSDPYYYSPYYYGGYGSYYPTYSYRTVNPEGVYYGHRRTTATNRMGDSGSRSEIGATSPGARRTVAPAPEGKTRTAAEARELTGERVWELVF